MELKPFVVLTTLAMTLYTGSAVAQCEQYKCEGVTNTFMQSLKSSDSGIFLTFPLGTATTLSCELKQGRFAELDQSSPSFSSMHSLLLTAIASNAPTVIEFSPVEAFCRVTSVEILVTE